MNLPRLFLFTLCLLPLQLLGQDIEIDFSKKEITRDQTTLEIKAELNTTWSLPFGSTKIKFIAPDQKAPSFTVYAGLAEVDDFSFEERLLSSISTDRVIIKFANNMALTLTNRKEQTSPVITKIDIDKIPNDPQFVFPYMTIAPDYGVDYMLVLDFENQKEKLSKFNGTTWQERKRTTIGSNRLLALKIVSNSQNTAYNRIGHEVTYKTHFLEDGERFRGLLGGQSGEQEEETEAETPVAEEEEGADLTSDRATKLKTALSNLGAQLTSFTKFTFESYPDQQRFEADYTIIKQNIIRCFSISEYDTDQFLAALSRAAEDNTSIHKLIGELSPSLRKLDNYKVYSPEFLRVKRADQLDLNIKFYKGGVTEPIDTRMFDYRLKGGFKIDFSTGLFYTNLKNKNYTSIGAENGIDDMGTPDDTSDDETFEQKQIVLENEDNSSMGLGILAHFYPKVSSGVNIGGTFGFVVKDDVATEFALGGSLLVPAFQGQRLVFSYGGVFGEERMLRSKYSENQTLKASDLANISDDQLTIAQKEWSWFISITFNFGSVNLQK